MQYRVPVSSWSKAPWGLSVLAQVTTVDGVAVENAQESLKEVAKYLTKSNEDDGVSYFIQNKL